MIFFEKRYYCVLCEKFHSVRKMKHIYDEIGVCYNCYENLKTTKDKSFDGGDGISAVFSPFFYMDDVAEAVKTYKFGGFPMYGGIFGIMMYSELKDISYIWESDCIIPVPLYQKRFEERGYNQSELMARKISELSGLPIIDDALFRIRETKRQSSLVGIERRENVRGAFYAHPDSVSGKRVLLVDDVCTMGETLRACAEALRIAGAREVLAITFCVSKTEEEKFSLY